MGKKRDTIIWYDNRTNPLKLLINLLDGYNRKSSRKGEWAKMNLKNEITQNSLRCLQHPATWLSIALLLINDHILKGIYPSWVTGKLSDFAGLFFFPFIVGAVFSLLLSRFNIPTKRIGQISFGFVGIWFITLKIFPWVNLMTTSLASKLVGYPTRFIMDPTDLVALSAMIPAWMIWRQPNPQRPTRAAYTAFLLGSLAVMATSPREWTILKVTNLEYGQDGVVYAAENLGPDNANFPIGVSMDGGLTWQETTEVKNIELKSLPLLHCGRLNPEICYRLNTTGTLKVLGPDNEWVNVEELVLEDIYLKGEDMILFEWEDSEIVIVAVGKYGILRRELPDGAWQVIPVLSADEPLSLP
jgi:hypothetical protein